MDASDPRHGTEAGFEKHVRDNEDPCASCYQADIIAGRRRQKRRTMGHQFTRPVGEQLHTHLANLRAEGARLDDIAEWAGVTNSQVHRILKGGPEGRIYARTWLALANMKTRSLVTPIGTQRRLQALTCRGWSPPAIAEHCGLHKDTITDIRNKGITSTAVTRATIAAAYEELCMADPPTDTVVQRRAVGLIRAVARRNGYLPPLAWENVDDPAEVPNTRDNRYRTKGDYDHAVVERVINGDKLRMTTPERTAVVRQMSAAGWSQKRIEEHTGITKADRYVEQQEAS